MLIAQKIEHTVTSTSLVVEKYANTILVQTMLNVTTENRRVIKSTHYR